MPQKQSRRKRGVFLSPIGWQRLQSAERQAEIQDNEGVPYTLEALSARSNLSPNTITKVRRRQAAVDRQTLEAYFSAFRLQLRAEDYQSIDAVREAPNATSASQGQGISSIPFYILRTQLERLCGDIVRTPGGLLHIRGPRQVGKTSLMAKAATQSDLPAVILSLKLADHDALQNLNRFLLWLCQAIVHALGRSDEPLLDRDNFSCTAFLEALLTDLKAPLVLALDDVDTLLQQPAMVTDFINLIRAWHELAHYGQDRSSIWQQLRIIIVHSNEIYLADWETQLSLEFGAVLDVPNFTQAEVNELSERYGLERPDAISEKLIHFLNGKPNLTQLALHHLRTHQSTIDQITSGYLSPDSIFAEHLLYYLALLQQHPELLDSFQQVVQADQPVLLPPLQAFKLSRLGLTLSQGQMVLPLCHLYRVYFGHVLYS
ncbi:MAG: AAA-like domain-containing protein [Cyanobacteria bacterium J06632_3]